jgi:hypothetical protein
MNYYNKYIKYKTKYNIYKNGGGGDISREDYYNRIIENYKDNLIYIKSGSSILSNEELLKSYKKQTVFKSILDLDAYHLDLILKYIRNRFYVKIDKKAISELENDYEIYLLLRNTICDKCENGAPSPDSICSNCDNEEAIDKFEILRGKIDDMYIKLIAKKADGVFNFISQSYINFFKWSLYDKIYIKPFFIMDIGTEHPGYLLNLSSKFETEDVYGLNIREGFEHYNLDEWEGRKLNEEKKKELKKWKRKIFFYDSLNIANNSNIYTLLEKHKKIFDLITIISVIHHIEQSFINEWLGKVCEITNTIYIKDNDIYSHKNTENFIEIQHALYEGVLYPGSRSTLNNMLRYSEIIDILKTNGFVVYSVLYENSPLRQFEIYAIRKNLIPTELLPEILLQELSPEE